MYPPEAGLRAEDSILEQLASQARETLAQLKTDGVVGDDVVSPVGGIARVFLGSRGSKSLRHSPVPVLVIPG